MQITVPDSIGSNPLEIIIGGVNYYLGAGETVNVPDAVATELARMLAAMTDSIKPVPAPFEELPAVTAADNDKILTVVEGAWAPAAAPSGLPEVSATDNGDVLTVVDGAWAAATPSGGGASLFVVNATGSNEGDTLDKTYSEIRAAVDANQIVRIQQLLDDDAGYSFFTFLGVSYDDPYYYVSTEVANFRSASASGVLTVPPLG